MDDALKTVPGVTSKMLVKFGENEIKTVEDLAGCATDDLVGWTERKEGGEPTKHPGILDPNATSRDEAANKDVGHVLTRFFSGKPLDLAIRLVEGKGASREELRRLKALIERHEASAE